MWKQVFFYDYHVLMALNQHWFFRESYKAFIIYHYVNTLGHLISLLVLWRRHQMETFSALLAICVGNPSITGEFPSQRPVTRSFDVLFGLPLNKRLS